MDLGLSLLALLVCFPLVFILALMKWLEDFRSPFFFSPRIGINSKPFRMVKLRSMKVNSHLSGIDSTSADDMRITKFGGIIRRYKLDELPQFWNIVLGHMSFVGPRPNVKRETDLYSTEEKQILTVRPGLTDLASIVFSDEGKILEGKPNPDLTYNQLIRPLKSRLGIFYVQNRNLKLDFLILFLTFLSVFSRTMALRLIKTTVHTLSKDENLAKLCARETELVPMPPPGFTKIVVKRT
jgi:lipopolysaccharide/colanic/teichoic acid biosynthesis glycosyltransferase